MLAHLRAHLFLCPILPSGSAKFRQIAGWKGSKRGGCSGEGAFALKLTLSRRETEAWRPRDCAWSAGAGAIGEAETRV